jgi:hypothetical protein
VKYKKLGNVQNIYLLTARSRRLVLIFRDINTVGEATENYSGAIRATRKSSHSAYPR